MLRELSTPVLFAQPTSAMYHLNQDWFNAVGRIAVSPLDGLGVFVVAADVAQEFGAQIGLGAEDAARDQMTLEIINYFKRPTDGP